MGVDRNDKEGQNQQIDWIEKLQKTNYIHLMFTPTKVKIKSEIITPTYLALLNHPNEEISYRKLIITAATATATAAATAIFK